MMLSLVNYPARSGRLQIFPLRLKNIHVRSLVYRQHQYQRKLFSATGTPIIWLLWQSLAAQWRRSRWKFDICSVLSSGKLRSFSEKGRRGLPQCHTNETQSALKIKRAAQGSSADI